MGSCFRHTCSVCGFSATTDGPWGVPGDTPATPEPRGHPADGLVGNLYCVECMIGFRAPVATCPDTSPEKSAFEGRCPCCGSDEILFLDRTPGRSCPVCGDGVLNSEPEGGS